MNLLHVKIFILAFLFLTISYNSFSQEFVTDCEGNNYATIKIGEQIWMARNLNTIHYANGEKINSVCYDNDTAYCRIYGRLYTWNALNVGENSDSLLSVCPDNWHISTDEEWDILLDSVGGFRNAGTILRIGKYSDFNLQWGGNYQSELTIFSFINRNAYFWSSTKYSKSAAWMRMIGANMKNVNRSTAPKEYAFSIRCVKD